MWIKYDPNDTNLGCDFKNIWHMIDKHIAIHTQLLSCSMFDDDNGTRVVSL